MKFNSDFKYDLLLGNAGENIISELLKDSTIEVKMDFLAHKTNNIFIEFRSRNKLSGISTTQAEFWFYIILKKDTQRDPNKITIKDVKDIRFFKVDKLKKICREWLISNKPLQGGDNNTSLGCCIPLSLL